MFYMALDQKDNGSVEEILKTIFKGNRWNIKSR